GPASSDRATAWVLRLVARQHAAARIVDCTPTLRPGGTDQVNVDGGFHPASVPRFRDIHGATRGSLPPLDPLSLSLLPEKSGHEPLTTDQHRKRVDSPTTS